MCASSPIASERLLPTNLPGLLPSCSSCCCMFLFPVVLTCDFTRSFFLPDLPHNFHRLSQSAHFGPPCPLDSWLLPSEQSWGPRKPSSSLLNHASFKTLMVEPGETTMWVQEGRNVEDRKRSEDRSHGYLKFACEDIVDGKRPVLITTMGFNSIYDLTRVL